MDTLQRQIFDLNHKVDQLHEIVERVSSQITSLTSDFHHHTDDNHQTEMIDDEVSSHNYGNGVNYRYNYQIVMEHKDILLDHDTSDGHLHPQSEQKLSPEIQIRRLTAQLTAAYNRIAALEEQLLAVRIKG